MSGNSFFPRELVFFFNHQNSNQSHLYCLEHRFSKCGGQKPGCPEDSQGICEVSTIFLIILR